MEITLRGKKYQGENVTDINYLALGQLFIDKNGQFTIEGVEDYESLPQSSKLKLVQPLMKKLSDPDEKAAIAHALTSIFPSLPRELVRYNGKGDFAMNLNLTELLQVAIAVGNELGKKEGVSQEELAKTANIARLEEELAKLKSGVGFAK